MSHRKEAGAIPPWVVPENAIKSSPFATNGSSGGRSSQFGTNNNNVYKEPGEVVMPNPTGAANTTPIKRLEDNSKKIYISGGCLVNNDHIKQCDILINNGRIESIADDIDLGVDKSEIKCIDASDHFILPGGVDFATNLIGSVKQFDASAYLEATKQLVQGGTTTIVDTLVCPRGRLPLDVLAEYRQALASLTNQLPWCNIVIRLALLEINQTVLDQMERLVNVEQINSFLFFVTWPNISNASDNANLVIPTSEQLMKALGQCRQLGALAVIAPLAPLDTGLAFTGEQIEARIVEQVIECAEAVDCPLVLLSLAHLVGLDLTLEARRRLPPVHVVPTCSIGQIETFAKSIGSNNNDKTATKFLTALSTNSLGLITGQEASLIKPSGLPLTSNRLNNPARRMAALWNCAVPHGWLDPSSFVNLVATGPSQHLGLYPRKGSLTVGADADLVFWPRSNVGGGDQQGITAPSLVMVEGKLVSMPAQSSTLGNLEQFAKDGPGGCLLGTSPFPQFVYDRVMASQKLRDLHRKPVGRDPVDLKSLNLNDTHSPQLSPASPPPTPNSPMVQDVEPVTTPTSQSGRRGPHHRDLHASGFSLSGAQVDDDRPLRTSIKTKPQVNRNPLW